MAFTRNGYGQIEPNQLSAQKTGQIYASLPLDSAVSVLENGAFMYYDYATGKVTADGEGEPMLVYNEIKLYDDWRVRLKDFALIRVGDNYVTSDLVTDEMKYDSGINPDPAHTEAPYRMDGFAPRLFKTNVGDIYTTNMVKVDGTVDYAQGDYLAPVKDSAKKVLVLEKKDNKPASGMVWVVAKRYTMPDGQPGVKLQRIQ